MKWNFCAFIVGPPEYGKTTIARAIVRRHLAETNGIALVHDPVEQFRKDGCAAFKDAAQWRAAAAVAAKEKKPMARGASLGGSSEAIVALAMQLGKRAGNHQENVKLPILVVIDEGSTNDSSGSTWISKEDLEALATRRHRGVGFVFNLQTPTMLTEKFWLLSTDVYAFACTTEHARVLDSRMMLEKGTLERAGLCSLPEHRYLHIKRRDGVVPEAL
jgi:hypothetical protein